MIQQEKHGDYWFLPGGFMEWEETCENTAMRESLEETNLPIEIKRLVNVYSDSRREPEGTHEGRHTITIVYFAESLRDSDKLCAGDDALAVGIFPLNKLPDNIWNFHRLIINDFMKSLKCSECQFEYYAKTVESCLCDALHKGVIDGSSTLYKDRYNKNYFELNKCPLRGKK